MKDRRIEDLYRRAEQELTAVADAVQRQDAIDMEKLSDLATAIAEAVRRDDHLVVHALAGPNGPPLVTNLVNASILAAKVGAGLGYYGSELHRLVLAGLVHDIGLFAVPQSLVTKSGRLTNDERTLIEQHPELGYQVIRQAGPAWEWLAQVVRQAHERWNGQGYPNRLKGRNISELAQIIGVVDVFDALVTPRPYRRRFFPHEAVRELIVAERLAFPREIVKALVEQLSAYPLGTLVRLTTGEIGTVVRINAEFPLRPVVEIGKDPGAGNGQERRQVDLSRAPLVSIIETLEPPDVARVSFHADHSVERRTSTGPSVSVQFSSLLESLDAIASAIQGMVESRTPAAETRSLPEQASSRPQTAEPAEATWQKEVIGLFALEAHEWLGQIYSALRRLGERPKGSMKSNLYGIMLQGLTNLAKSAAAVRQPAIEDLATGLLPVLQDVSKEDSHQMQTALASLQDGLDRIASAVRQATGETDRRAPSAGALEEPSWHQRPAIAESVEERRDVPAPIVATSGSTLLNALRDLQAVRSRSLQPARDVLEAVVEQAGRHSGELTVSGVREILADLDRSDEHFLQEVRTRVPSINRALETLRREGATQFATTSQLDPVVEQVEALYERATQVQAGTITMFLQGVRTFLLVAGYRKSADLAQRWEAVEDRIQSLVPMAEQWVAVGRVERAAISEILPG